VYKPNARREGVSIRQTWVAAGFFSGVGKLRGLETKVPPVGSRVDPWWWSGTKPPEADEKL